MTELERGKQFYLYNYDRIKNTLHQMNENPMQTIARNHKLKIEFGDYDEDYQNSEVLFRISTLIPEGQYGKLMRHAEKVMWAKSDDYNKETLFANITRQWDKLHPRVRAVSSPTMVARILQMKHEDCVESATGTEPLDYLFEKCGDWINYYIMIKWLRAEAISAD